MFKHTAKDHLKTPAIACFMLTSILTLAINPAAAFAPDGGQEIITLLGQAQAKKLGGDKDGALFVLRRAEHLCVTGAITGPVAAAVYVNLGTLEAEHNDNNAAGLDLFRRALCQDPTATPVPGTSQAVLSLFEMGRLQASTPGGCDAGTGAMVPVTGPAAPQPNIAHSNIQVIRHKPVSEQRRMTPIPIFVEVNPVIQGVGDVLLYYRASGEPIFQMRQMENHGAGYAAVIGCETLEAFEPIAIDYYVAVLSKDNRVIGGVGDKESPHTVAFVDEVRIGTAPALPGEPAPERCERECPPWNPECNSDCKALGDLCKSDADCCSGMTCEHGSCDQGAEEEDFVPKMTLAANAGTGFGLAKGDTTVPDNQIHDGYTKYPGGASWNKFHFRVTPLFHVGDSGKVRFGATFRGDLTLDSDPEMPKFGPAGILNLSYKVAGTKPTGFTTDLLFGLGAGVIYHRVPYVDCPGILADENSDHPLYPTGDEGYIALCTEDSLISKNGQLTWDETVAEEKAFYRKSGYFIVELGLNINYWISKHFGLDFGLITDTLMPRFAFNVDVQAGLILRF